MIDTMIHATEIIGVLPDSIRKDQQGGWLSTYLLSRTPIFDVFGSIYLGKDDVQKFLCKDGILQLRPGGFDYPYSFMSEQFVQTGKVHENTGEITLKWKDYSTDFDKMILESSIKVDYNYPKYRSIDE